MSQRTLRLALDPESAAFLIKRQPLDGELVVSRELVSGATGRHTKSFLDYRDSDNGILAVLEEAHRLLREWEWITNQNDRPLAEFATYQGISLWRASELNLLLTLLVPFVDVLSVLERIFEVERPKAVEILGGDRVATLAAVALAKSRGVPVQWNPTERRFSRGRVRSAFDCWPLGFPEVFLPLARRIRPVVIRLIGQLWNGWVNARVPLAGKKKILGLTVNSRFADILLPVFAELAANPENELLIVDKDFSSATGRLRSVGSSFRVFSGYETRTIARQVTAARRQFMHQWMTLRQDSTFRDGWRCRDVNCWMAVEPKLHEYFTRLFPQLVRIIEITRELIRRESPRTVVLVDERPPFQRAFVEATKRMGIPTVNIQNAIYANIPYGSPIATNYVLVDGELFKDNLAARGTDPSRIVVTGQPRFDFLARKDKRFDRLSICKRLLLDPTVRMVLFVSHPVSAFDPAEERRTLLHAICVAVKTLPRCWLVIKLHPDETDDRFHREITTQAQLEAVRIVRHMDTWELLYASDVVIVASSTMGYEAIVMDRPLIQIIYRAHGHEIYPYAESGAALEVKCLGEIGPVLSKALDDHGTRQALQRGRNEAVKRFAYCLDGQASTRAARFIEQVTEAGVVSPESLSPTGMKR